MTITIAHRVKTIMNCKHIFVFEAGRVQEQGAFKDLQRFKHMDIEQEDMD